VFIISIIHDKDWSDLVAFDGFCVRPATMAPEQSEIACSTSGISEEISEIN